LIGDYPIVHGTTHDAKNPGIEEELKRKAGRGKRHRQEMTMLAAVWLVPIYLQIVQKNWPKRFPATLNQGFGEMGFKNAKAIVL
jgi:hypothetical protein